MLWQLYFPKPSQVFLQASLGFPEPSWSLPLSVAGITPIRRAGSLNRREVSFKGREFSFKGREFSPIRRSVGLLACLSSAEINKTHSAVPVERFHPGTRSAAGNAGSGFP